MEVEQEGISDNGVCQLPLAVWYNIQVTENVNEVNEEVNEVNESAGADETAVEIPKRKRRRIADPDAWERNVRKNNRLAGKSYVDRKKRVIPAKTVKRVECKCRFKCRDKISLEQQQTQFEQFRSLPTSDSQKDFILNLVSEKPVRRRRKRNTDSEIDKQVSRCYTLIDADGEKIRVCQPFFLKTFAISKSVVHVTMQNKSSKGTYKGDKRTGGANATPVKVVRQVRAFLNAFPKFPSAQNCPRKISYLAPDLNIPLLHKLFNDIPKHGKVSEPVFRSIFKDFDPPLSCLKLKNECLKCYEAEKTGKYSEHRNRKFDMETMKELDLKSASGSKTLVCASFDLPAVLQIPFVGDCPIYYQRKLSLFNFTVCDSLKNGSCFLWDETHGEKGSAEIGSCLLSYIRCLEPEVEGLILYCGKQNRNQNIVSALLYAMNADLHPNLNTVDIKYVEGCHRCLETDTLHAAIERCQKRKDIYTPNEYKLIIELARKRPRPYVVHPRKFGSVYNLDKLTESVMKNKTKDSDDAKINWAGIRWFRFGKNSSVVQFKYGVKEDFHQFVVNPKPIVWDNINLEQKYSGQLPISLAKKKDLASLLRKGLIPAEYKSFVKDLPSAEDICDEAVWINEAAEDED